MNLPGMVQMFCYEFQFVAAQTGISFYSQHEFSVSIQRYANRLTIAPQKKYAAPTDKIEESTELNFSCQS